MRTGAELRGRAPVNGRAMQKMVARTGYVAFLVGGGQLETSAGRIGCGAAAQDKLRLLTRIGRGASWWQVGREE